ncbi:MAG: heavy metal-associated domain-containing protein [Patescibacteria group bacterium]
MQKMQFKIGGLDCSSCAFNIDGTLEDLEGIGESKTNFAKQITEVTFDPKKISPKKIQESIIALEYAADMVT